MPLPTLHPGHDPTTTPATSSGATFGGAVAMGPAGLQPNPIRGISIAFGSAANAEAPLWQNILTLGR